MKKVDIYLGFAMVAVAGVFYYMISKLPEKAIQYPIFVTTLLLFLSLIHLAISFSRKDDGEASGFESIEWKQLAFVLLTSGIYVGILKLVGYVVSTIIYILAVLFGLKVNKKLSIVISVGFSLVIYVLFKIILKVPLPKGIII